MRTNRRYCSHEGTSSTTATLVWFEEQWVLRIEGPLYNVDYMLQSRDYVSAMMEGERVLEAERLPIPLLTE